MAKVASSLSDFSVITSDNPDREDPNDIIDEIVSFMDADKSRYITITERDKAINYALSFSTEGDIIVLAGKGHEKYQIVNGQKVFFDEKGIIERYYR